MEDIKKVYHNLLYVSFENRIISKSENTRGLETKNTLKGALEKLGFTGGTHSDTELAQWQNAEKDKPAKIVPEYGRD